MFGHGLRLLRQSEIERIHGVQLRIQHYATALAVLGQGVQSRLFRRILQLGDHLAPGILSDDSRKLTSAAANPHKPWYFKAFNCYS
jgi:hypothetical protein